jgi:hypothetical protein
MGQQIILLQSWFSPKKVSPEKKRFQVGIDYTFEVVKRQTKKYT